MILFVFAIQYEKNIFNCQPCHFSPCSAVPVPYLKVRAEQCLVSSSCMFLCEKTLLKNWINLGLNLTMFRGTGPRSTVEPRFSAKGVGKFVGKIEDSLYRTPPFNEFSRKLPKCSLYRGKVRGGGGGPRLSEISCTYDPRIYDITSGFRVAALFSREAQRWTPSAIWFLRYFNPKANGIMYLEYREC